MDIFDVGKKETIGLLFEIFEIKDINETHSFKLEIADKDLSKLVLHAKAFYAYKGGIPDGRLKNSQVVKLCNKILKPEFNKKIRIITNNNKKIRFEMSDIIE